MADQAQDPIVAATATFAGRTGATSFQIRYDDEQDPVIWVCVAEYRVRDAVAYKTGSGITPGAAAVALASDIADGGTCAHCGKPSGATDDWSVEMPLADVICWYVFDPETSEFRRSCEGDTSGLIYGRNPRTGEYVGRNNQCPCGSGRKWKRCHGAPGAEARGAA
jgi:hypothetical protein